MSDVDGLLVCSHRGPHSYLRVDGRIEQRQGSGGLVSALTAVLRGGSALTWLACALSDTDREVARGAQVADPGPIGARLLELPAEMHRSYYDDACVTGLGFLFHGLFDQAYGPTFDVGFRRGWEAYQEVNRTFARALADAEAERPVLVEDYHLMLVADELRELRPKRSGALAYFHHVPWCPPVYFAFLPTSVRIRILTGLLAFDTLGFHSRRWADEFLSCCEAFLPGVHCTPDAVRWRGRAVGIVVAPAQVDPEHLRTVTAGPEAERWRRRLRRRVVDGRRTVVRVDRVDLWKNIVRGFGAYERMMLDRGAEDVDFLAILARSRLHLPQYRRYLADCQRKARQVRQRLAAAGRSGTVTLLLGDAGDHPRALAGLSQADVVLVNSTSDGLNLVAKEGVVAAEGRSRLVLSEHTGVYEEIGSWAYRVNPFDVDETAAVLAQALGDTRGRPELLDAVVANSPDDWLRRRLAGLPGVTTP